MNMLNFFTITAAALSLAIGTAQAGEPVEASEAPTTAQPVTVLVGTVVDTLGGSDMHAGWVEVQMPAANGEQWSTTISEVAFPTACRTEGDTFHIVFEGTSTTITCGEPTK
jgi:hypothetical protein